MEPQSSSLFSLTIDPVTKGQLESTAKWGRFLAIVGMILLALALVVIIGSMLLMGTIYAPDSNSNYTTYPVMNSNIQIGMVAGTIVMLAISFFPLLYLLRFSNDMRLAMHTNDQARLNRSFQNLKVYFRYLGIVLIIVLVVYALIFIFAITGYVAFFNR